MPLAAVREQPQGARSIFLMDFMSAFVLALRYFFKPKVTLN